MFTLMHISDLHRSISAPISNNELLSSLVLDRDKCSNEQPSINNPDAIIVSGDLVQGLPIGHIGYPADLERQYEEAFAFLVELANTFVEGDRSKVIVVPGNHDVDWTRADGLQTC